MYCLRSVQYSFGFSPNCPDIFVFDTTNPLCETPFRHDPKLEFCELIIPTVDSVRYTYLLNLLVAGDKHVLMTGTAVDIAISTIFAERRKIYDPRCVQGHPRKMFAKLDF